MVKKRIIRTNQLGYIDVKVPANIDVLDFAESFKYDPQIESVDINSFGEFETVTPNDQYYSNQWYLNKIQMSNAWDYTMGSNCVIIAIIESGTDWTHQDLGTGNDACQNIWLNTNEDNWTDPNDPTKGNHIDDDGNGLIDNDSRGTYWHGTHVSGIVSAKTNNITGIAGIDGGNNIAGIRLKIKNYYGKSCNCYEQKKIIFLLVLCSILNNALSQTAVTISAIPG